MRNSDRDDACPTCGTRRGEVHESARLYARIDEARFHKLMVEHDPLTPPA